LFSSNPYSASINALLQATALFASSQGVIWAMYPIMAMLCYIGFMQSIAAASLFSGFIEGSTENEDPNYSISILVAILYLVSSYHVYTLGYGVIAGIMFTHATIFLFTNVLGVLKERKD
jgi:hypothetical protein